MVMSLDLARRVESVSRGWNLDVAGSNVLQNIYAIPYPSCRLRGGKPFANAEYNQQLAVTKKVINEAYKVIEAHNIEQMRESLERDQILEELAENNLLPQTSSYIFKDNLHPEKLTGDDYEKLERYEGLGLTPQDLEYVA